MKGSLAEPEGERFFVIAEVSAHGSTALAPASNVSYAAGRGTVKKVTDDQ
jgi:hypothetical protein